MSEILSPLRYPCGKTRAIKTILPLLPCDFTEFCEPFVGGGSVFLAVKQQLNSKAHFVINDLNYDLFCFWKFAKEANRDLCEAVMQIKQNEKDGRHLFNYYTSKETYTDFERAVRFFVLNRITFSGTVDSGGYSNSAFYNRFTVSSIERLRALESILQNVIIKNQSYEEIIFDNSGERRFIFLDPPYYRQAKSRLYGKNGSLHLGFNHEKFAADMKKCPHRWLITLDNTDKIKALFSGAFIYEWELQYGMNNYKQAKAALGKELFIANYPLSCPLREISTKKLY
jgi:DNA adenine methylase